MAQQQSTLRNDDDVGKSGFELQLVTPAVGYADPTQRTMSLQNAISFTRSISLNCKLSRPSTSDGELQPDLEQQASNGIVIQPSQSDFDANSQRSNVGEEGQHVPTLTTPDAVFGKEQEYQQTEQRRSRSRTKKCAIGSLLALCVIAGVATLSANISRNIAVATYEANYEAFIPSSSSSSSSKSGKGKSGKGKSGKGKSGKGKSGKGKSAKAKCANGKSGTGKSGKGKSAKGKCAKEKSSMPM